ncbi:hypothetical protein PVAND_005510 [Polypedilum vanderplanki]|uniref:BED-type domain-containing protein n=1 Tax=Polypedilum vanderplanki TaxID=319348 RepID=A0A9J6C197_POLVA|nr:hypothetical protein PVAND_005510 [Polypedilum vanderplanki]
MSGNKRKRSKNDISNIEHQILHSESILTVKIDENKKSSICWQYFGYLYRNDQLLDDLHYYCSLCVPNNLKSRYMKNSSTSSLLSHLATKHNINTSKIENAIVRVGSTSTDNAGVNKKTLLARKIALWLSRDLRPFNTTSTPGFKQFAMDTGLVKSLDELPSERTIAGSALNDVYQVVEDSLKKKMGEINSIFSLMADIWTDNNGNRPFINISIQYLSQDYRLNIIHLTTETFERPHTGEKIAKFIENVLQAFELQQKFYFISDGAKNMENAAKFLKNCLGHFKCIAHSLNLVLSVDLEKSPSFKVHWSPVIKKIKKIHGSIVYRLYELKQVYEKDQSKEIIGYLDEWEDVLAEEILTDENIGLNDGALSEIFNDMVNRMPEFNAFKVENTTRWNSKYSMIKSFLSNTNAINVCLAKVNQTDLILSPDELKKANAVCDLLGLFESSLKIFQSSTEPTANLIILFYNIINKKLSNYIDREEPYSDIWNQTLLSIKERIKVYDEFILASILDPSQCRSNILAQHCENIGSTPINIISLFLEKYELVLPIEMENSSSYLSENLTVPISLVSQMPVTNFKASLLMEIEGTEEIISADSIEEEYQKYIGLSLTFPKTGDILIFWNMHKNDLPRLSKLAKIILSLSPTSAECERAFSMSGVLLNSKRAHMNQTKARKVSLINSNYKLVDEIIHKKK